ncbi:MAG: 4'-phosphopantetheinyl transferase family protein [Chitinophagaceae bacterium]
MPLIYQHSINSNTRLGVWQITEQENFFLSNALQAPASMHPQRRLQYLAARFLLTELIPDFPIDAIALSDAGKPHLPNGAFDFSISHTADFAAAIVSTDAKVGIDAEIPAPRIFKVQHKFMHPEELDLIAPFENILPLQTLLTVCWSAKETLYKWHGVGQLDFKQHLRLVHLEGDEKQGIITAQIAQCNGERIPLAYSVINGFVLCWAATDR